MRDLKRILELRFENHSQREIARMLKVSRNTVRDVFDAADAAGVYWNTAYNLSESQINELLFPSNGIVMFLMNSMTMHMCIRSF